MPEEKNFERWGYLAAFIIWIIIVLVGLTWNNNNDSRFPEETNCYPDYPYGYYCE